jgi:hypothetical protein
LGSELIPRIASEICCVRASWDRRSETAHANSPLVETKWGPSTSSTSVHPLWRSREASVLLNVRAGDDRYKRSSLNHSFNLVLNALNRMTLVSQKCQYWAQKFHAIEPLLAKFNPLHWEFETLHRMWFTCISPKELLSPCRQCFILTVKLMVAFNGTLTPYPGRIAVRFPTGPRSFTGHVDRN